MCIESCSAELEALRKLANLCVSDRNALEAGHLAYHEEMADIIESRGNVAERALALGQERRP
jgi:hypothetical protein